MKVQEILENVYWVEFPKQRQLAETFLRFQERYENPEARFRTQPFTLAEFKVWYKSKFKRFTYYSDWSGFNLPGTMLEPFYRGEFKELSKLELSFLKEFTSKDLSKIYIIGTSRDNKNEALDHEIAHAMFGTNEEYRIQVLRILHKYHQALLPVYVWLDTQKYGSNVLHDEAHAYAGVDAAYLKNDEGFDIAPLAQVSDELYALFCVFKRRLDKRLGLR